MRIEIAAAVEVASDASSKTDGVYPVLTDVLMNQLEVATSVIGPNVPSLPQSDQGEMEVRAHQN